MGNINLLNLYLIISTLFVLLDFVTAMHCFFEHKNYSHVLGITCISVAAIQILYLFSISANSYFLVSLLSSLYFLGIAFSVVLLLTFIRSYTIKIATKRDNIVKQAVSIGFIVDVLLFLTNLSPRHEIMAHYLHNESGFVTYIFVQKPLYWLHLAFVYILVAMVLYHLIKRASIVPREYRRQYYKVVLGLLAVVGLNAIYLFVPKLFGEEKFDYSLWGYSIVAFLLYKNFFRYPVKGMRTFYNEWIVENINQAIVLFNFENRLIIHNEKVHSIFPNSKIENDMTVEEFTKQLNLNVSQNSDEDYSFQHYVEREDGEFPIRFDHRCLRNNSGVNIGELFVFTDEKGDVDLLTSFYTWEKFKQVVNDEPENFRAPFTVAVCDIIGLGDINDHFGKNVGDQAIELLADTVRKNLSGEAYYIRGQEASLIVLSFDMEEEEVQEQLDIISDEILANTSLGCLINIQTATGVVRTNNDDVLAIVKQAFLSMKNKKLLNTKSRKSELISSLVKTLSECDQDTEAHVKRTQHLGSELGMRLGLTDVQLSDLALLCILHDIGKIGIPLEILNKPAKLSESETRVMRSHVEKGYQIAKTSQELDHIADMILHHHESWNGSGYPDGLTKESIPLLSRIIAVVDAYDAMTNDRTYRSAMPIEEAINELKRCAGTQFDPSIVNEFIKMIPEISDNPDDSKLDILDNSNSGLESLFVTGDESKSTVNVHKVNYTKYILDENMRIFEIDDNFERLTGYSKKDIEDNVITQMDLIPEDDLSEYLGLVSEQLSHSNLAYFEHRLKRKDGTILFVFCSGKTYFDSAEKAGRSEIIVFDSSTTYAVKLLLNEEKNKADARISKWEDKYRCDSLTGLLNHEALKSDVELRLLANGKVMFIMMDVDKFKNYNDTYGHKAGDEFLIMLSQNLSGALRKDDLACRMGGDEFSAVLFYNDSGSEQIMYERAQQICDKLNLVLSSTKGGTSLSMGVVIADKDINTFNKLYVAADKALYRAKESGRAKMVIYDKNIDEEE